MALASLSTIPHEVRKWQGPGRGGSRDALHVHVPDASPPQAAGTLYCPMDVDDVPAAGGSRGTSCSSCWSMPSRRTISRSPSRLSKCPRSSSTSSHCELLFASRNWRNSWWKRLRSCLSLRSSGSLSSRLVLHGESLQGFLPGHGSTALSSSSHVPAGAVDEPFQGVFLTFPRG